MANVPNRLHLLDVTLPELAANVALDEALLLAAEAGGPEVLRFWEWPAPAVVLGAAGQWLTEADVVACQRDAVPIVRRSSGGGAVVLGPGCLLYSLVLSYERQPELADLHASYGWILGAVANVLAPCAPGIACAGTSDLAVAGRKFSGNSQQRKRTHLLHHGTLLCSFDLTLMTRYLSHPPREPEYRGGRTHLDFVTNLQTPIETVKQQLAGVWGAVETATTLPEALLRQLLDERYARAEWHQRR